MKVTPGTVSPEEQEQARKIREKFAARKAASPPTPISKELMDKMTSGIADPEEATKEADTTEPGR